MARTTGNAKDLITFTRASTGTFLGSNGLLQTAAINTPRVEYDANGVAKGLLIEEARTNFVPYSDNLVAWSKVGVAAILDNTVSPPLSANGTVSKVTLNSVVNAQKYINVPSVSNPGGSAACFSVWLKYGTQQFVDIYGQYGLWMEGGSGCRVDLLNKTVTDFSGSTQSTITFYPNDWVHVQVISNFTVTGSGAPFYLWAVDSAGAGGTSGSSNTNTYFYAWGAQTEIGSFPTSYIPTSGATATRSADIASVSVSEFGYNQAQGSVVVEFSTADIDQINGIAFSDGTYNNRILLSLRSHPSAGRLPYISSGGVNTVALVNNTGIQNNVASKVAVAFASNDVASSLDGQAVVTDTSATIPNTITTLYFLDALGANYQINGHIKSINYYPLRLSDAKLQSLTS